MDKGLEKNITIADVAEALGVSKTTVSRAISGKGRIGRETRERVLAYIEEHDYKPNVIAKGLAQSKTYNICVVMPGEYDVVDLTFFQECLFGIQEIAGSMEYDILLSICRKNDISSLERIIANHKVDGVILMRTFVEDEQIDFSADKKCTVCHDRKYQCQLQRRDSDRSQSQECMQRAYIDHFDEADGQNCTDRRQ